MVLADINSFFIADETECVQKLILQAQVDAETSLQITARAVALVNAVRGRKITGIESFLHQYDLSTHEGVLLMCVAEALLRIPDAATADALIRDKFSQGNWKQHVGQSDSWLVNASTWGMLLQGRLSDQAPAPTDAISKIEKLFTRLTEPVARQAIRAAMGIMAEQFVMGHDIERAVKRSADKDSARYRYSFDMLGEAALTSDDAEKYFAAYSNAIEVVAKHSKNKTDIFAAPSISVKLSALHPRFEPLQKNRVMRELVPRVLALCEQARQAGIGITIDAEEAERLDLQLSVYIDIFSNSQLADWNSFGLAVQAYQKRAPHVIAWLAQHATQNAKRIPVRLVKGAYWDTEIKRAQMQGLAGYPVYTRKVNTDVAYIACAKLLLNDAQAFYAQFATHNAQTIASILELAQSRRDFEFQRLHGMGESLYGEVLKDNSLTCRVYAPVGVHADLLPYLVRRLLENGANTSFVNRIADEATSVEQVVADPVAAVRALKTIAHPTIPAPQNLYQPDRKNSAGLSFADVSQLKVLKQSMENFLASAHWYAAPMINGEPSKDSSHEVSDPADRRRKTGSVVDASLQDVDLALNIATAAAPNWNATPAITRADYLDRAADLIEAHRAELMALLIREAGKTHGDALSELREAADFCRYYALQARKHFAAPDVLKGPTGESNALSLHGRGVFVCISPWNFPLAIFVGQMAAALAAGNAVIAKPAEQTPLIACLVARLLHEAGIPKAVLCVLPGPGEIIGAALVNDVRTHGVVFTGSTATAQAINRSLAARGGAIIPFIAETGGVNVMIADSSALPEQVVNDVIASAFNSAGQRCSACRVLFLQEEIADRVLHILQGAMQELVIGDPAQLTTDIGPVIDADALSMLQNHQKKMRQSAKMMCEMTLPADCANGNFFAPCVYELKSLDELEGEVFGPVLHVVRFASKDMAKILNEINKLQYGLTLGIHSRIDDTIEFISAKAKVGNLYVNRNMIGAVVGVQPFGGEGLSGTGPKAGGPHYLFRFATERTVTINTAAVGGNASLLSDQGAA